MRNILLELKIIDTTHTVPVYCDSAVAKSVVEKHGTLSKVKRVDIKLHYVREQAERGEL